ncbi:DUF5809 family protein [Halodesulfurarchaeum sp.]|uniref:DUF5809 family protein n=1 Tax=Halodesulfurarchaeum sp. TaxID=1980530 RepID=UPI001BBDD2E2|nr:hypothetical protein [Halodesulfurarchaeum sp.]
METQGHFAPRTETAASAQFDDLALVAKTVTKEIAEAGTDTSGGYQALVEESVIETAQQTLFASLLEVHVGSVDEYEAWLTDHDSLEASLAGTETVPWRAWHPVWPRDQVTAVSYQNSPEAAIATVRRQAFGQHYRAILELA